MITPNLLVEGPSKCTNKRDAGDNRVQYRVWDQVTEGFNILYIML